MGTVRFVLRTDKPNKKGLYPIEIIYQLSVDKKQCRKYLRTREKYTLHSQNWDERNQKAIYLNRETAKKLLPNIDYALLPASKEVAEMNDTLGSIRVSFSEIEQAFRLNKEIYSVQDVVSKYAGSPTKKDAPNNQVFDFIDKYIEDNKATRVPGSLSVYKSMKNHLQAYQQKTKNKITFEKVDKSFFQAFQNFLVSRTKIVAKKEVPMLNNVTIAKQLSTLKTFLNYAKDCDIEVSGNYSRFEIKKEDLEVIHLTSDEFEKLYNFDLSNKKKLDQVRDVFCFSCATGLRYSDLFQLKREHIKKDQIILKVKKTGQQLIIPLNPYSFSILEKYSKVHRPIPVISNAKMNLFLKELCKLAEINEPVQIVRTFGSKREENTYPKHELVSCHTGRKSFAVLSLEKGMSAEEVMKIGGWKSYSSFCRYVNITNPRAKIVMNKAWGEIPKTKLIIV